MLTFAIMKNFPFMKNLLVSLLSLFALCAPASAQQKQSNVAYQDHQVRITLITDGVARLEYSPNGKFVDDYSQVAVNRTYAPVAFKLSQGGKNVKISTKAMVISYKKGTGRFSADNLTIASANKKAKGAFTWHPGLKDEANLKGTYRTLDGYDGNMRKGKPMPIEDGLLSRSGWTFIDDSKSYLFDHSDWPWVAERDTTADAQDWYFMAYGHNYKKALNDYTVFSGKVPLPPKFAFGYWWSRYWSYSDDEMRQLVKDFHDYDIPLDVLVVDMDWHYNQSPRGALPLTRGLPRMGEAAGTEGHDEPASCRRHQDMGGALAAGGGIYEDGHHAAQGYSLRGIQQAVYERIAQQGVETHGAQRRRLLVA